MDDEGVVVDADTDSFADIVVDIIVDVIVDIIVIDSADRPVCTIADEFPLSLPNDGDDDEDDDEGLPGCEWWNGW